MGIDLFSLPSEDLTIRTHLKTWFVVVGSLLSGSSHIIWKMLNNKLNKCVFYWDLSKVLTSFINLAYQALLQTCNMLENVSGFSFVCLHLQAEFSSKNQVSTFILLQTHSWMKTPKFAQLLALAYLFYYMIHNRPYRRHNEKPEANCFTWHLYISAGFANCLLHCVGQVMS